MLPTVQECRKFDVENIDFVHIVLNFEIKSLTKCHCKKDTHMYIGNYIITFLGRTK